jgi:hypothetical protein
MPLPHRLPRSELLGQVAPGDAGPVAIAPSTSDRCSRIGRPATGWIDTAPVEHIKYVNEINDIRAIQGGAKKLARLAKAWKYYNSVPISSF